MQSPTTAIDRGIDTLRARLRGTVIVPGDDGYDAARQVFQGDIDRRPAVIVRVADPADVGRAIAFAREAGLQLAVRSGGHSAAGHSTIDGGLVIDLRDLDEISIDPGARTVRAGAGLPAVELTRATGEHGLVVGFGDTGSVGIGGITLGGGVGYLVRRDGLTIDSLIAAELVTADGVLRRVDAETEPDLFWAIRGGGGNFGIATRFLYRLHETGDVVGGMLMLPATPETIAGFMAVAEAAPETVSAIANVMPAPPMPFVPAEAHGRTVIMALVVSTGSSTDEAAAGVAPFRALATPVADLLRPMAYAEIYPPEDASYRPKAIARSGFADRIDEPAAATILDRIAASDAPMRAVQLRVLGGAMARVPVDATAFAHRKARIMVNVASFYGGEDDRPTRATWVDELIGALVGDDPAAYVGFLADEGPQRVRAAYPGPTWDRLRAIKRRYDPDNVFRLNQNIPPA